MLMRMPLGNVNANVKQCQRNGNEDANRNVKKHQFDVNTHVNEHVYRHVNQMSMIMSSKLAMFITNEDDDAYYCFVLFLRPFLTSARDCFLQFCVLFVVVKCGLKPFKRAFKAFVNGLFNAFLSVFKAFKKGLVKAFLTAFKAFLNSFLKGV